MTSLGPSRGVPLPRGGGAVSTDRTQTVEASVTERPNVLLNSFPIKQRCDPIPRGPHTAMPSETGVCNDTNPQLQIGS
jgi:hypothetical protein